MLYHDVMAQIALRSNSLVGALPAALETTYITRPLTSANFDSGDFPFTAIKDALQTAEERICQTIAKVKGHPWRSFLNGVTGNLAHKATIPTVDAGSKQIIGVWSGVYDATDTTECQWKPEDYVTRKVRLSTFVIPNYYYNRT